jgi:regulator of sirC expression with transglutaminase-like and TPR domain
MHLGHRLVVLLEEFQLTLQVMLGVLMVVVAFIVTMDLTGIKFLELLLISVLVLMEMFGL